MAAHWFLFAGTRSVGTLACPGVGASVLLFVRGAASDGIASTHATQHAARRGTGFVREVANKGRFHWNNGANGYKRHRRARTKHVDDLPPYCVPMYHTGGLGAG